MLKNNGIVSNYLSLYTADPPDDEQQAWSKHVEAYYCNKLTENITSCWFMLYRYITMHGQQNFKLDTGP
jgi:histone deacetylase complex regulatory component SIN3